MKPDILYEDNDIIVCYKPAKLAVQTASTKTPDMVSILKNHIYKTAPKKTPPYLAVIHRLDQPVEGILVFAKTKPAAASFNKTTYIFWIRQVLYGLIIRHTRKLPWNIKRLPCERLPHQFIQSVHSFY